MEKNTSYAVHKIQFAEREISLISSVCTEVLYGFKLNDNEREILGSIELGMTFSNKIDDFLKKTKKHYEIKLSLDEVTFIRNAIIVVMIRLNKHNLYFTHMGFHLSDCLNLLNRVSGMPRIFGDTEVGLRNWTTV